MPSQQYCENRTSKKVKSDLHYLLSQLVPKGTPSKKASWPVNVDSAQISPSADFIHMLVDKYLFALT